MERRKPTHLHKDVGYGSTAQAKGTQNVFIAPGYHGHIKALKRWSKYTTN